MPSSQHPTILITGGTGFVMSNVVKHLLQNNPNTQLITLDLEPLSALTEEFFAAGRHRLTHIQGDIRDLQLLQHISNEHPITHIIHAATITHSSAWEQTHPAKYLDVNIMGTVNVLEWARQLPHLKRLIYVSTGGVYGEPLSDSPPDPQPEIGPVNPVELYGISKYTAEQIVRRYGEVFGLEVRRVRFSGVFGPMERPTVGRATMALPYRIQRAIIEKRPLSVTAETLQAGGDFLSATEIGRALSLILLADAPRHPVYNIAYGQFTLVSDLITAFQSVAPGFQVEIAPANEAEVDMRPEQRLARWNAYSIDRITNEFGWQPRLLDEQVQEYFNWVMVNPNIRCPVLLTKAGPLTIA